MSKDTGGPAFPVSELLNRHGETIQYPSEGMSLRDYFAGQAIIGLLSCPKPLNDATTLDGEDFAQMAYKLADSMIEAMES